MEVPRLGVESELQLLAYTTVTAMWDPSRVCDLHHSSQQRQILNPLNEARNRTRNFMVTSRICSHCDTAETNSSSIHEDADSNPTRIHEDADLIPGLIQWVKDLALLRAVV